ncbi:extracellular solute-binding protein [Salarchaeum sp. JOR-1]|uniref:extracellular solute-binding protein n=1 Tax=Salarchaeum sp. JOR-1 TaxID=2599399 RepID=UPI00119869B5|nr:extracellular solute-binding protein [Salarchaeum sp. JOR-1]QDX39423.1 extracellular solute-binding protein [Salarchaeum sp. JOR-1]
MRDSPRTRRRFLQATAAGSLAGLAGCQGLLGGSSDDERVTIPELATFRGSGAIVEGRPAPGGTSIEELPDLSGELSLYIGGGEGGIYYRFVKMLQEIYPDFTVYQSSAASASLAQNIVKEVQAGAAQADVFWSIDASSLGYVADNDAYEPLPKDVVEPVPEDFQGDDNAWVGVAGRARSVPYNTNQLSESDIPDAVQDFPSAASFPNTVGWAPTYGAFKSFITAMRLLRGPDATREWLVAMRENGAKRFPDEFVVSQRVADGVIPAGFANHYYAMRVKNQRPDAPLALAFTSDDAGALVNVAGALRIKGTEKDQLVNNFIKHLLSAEAQEFFATVSFAYPMIEGVTPVGGLPTIDELNPPDIDLSKLSNLEKTLEIMRNAGVLG